MADSDRSHISTMASSTDIEALIADFHSDDGAVRAHARQSLVSLGPEAVGGLVNALNHPSVRMRWEATKTLCELQDLSAAPALVGRLEGTDSGVRWMAADGLVAMGPVVLEPVLQALIQRSDSILLREGVHRVLHGLAGRPGMQTILQPVIDGLAAVEPAVVVPLAAYRALEALRARAAGPEIGITIRNVHVRDWMHPAPITVEPTTTLDEVSRLMKEKRIRRVLVVSHGRVAGIVSLGDVREAMAASAGERRQPPTNVPIENIMTREVLTVHPAATLRAAARVMLEHKIGGLPVMEGTVLVGIITESDIFRVLIDEQTGLD
jgi:CBS domain-containing protein